MKTSFEISDLISVNMALACFSRSLYFGTAGSLFLLTSLEVPQHSNTDAQRQSGQRATPL